MAMELGPELAEGADADAGVLRLVGRIDDATRALDRASDLFAGAALGDAATTLESILLSSRALSALLDGIVAALIPE